MTEAVISNLLFLKDERFYCLIQTPSSHRHSNSEVIYEEIMLTLTVEVRCTQISLYIIFLDATIVEVDPAAD